MHIIYDITSNDNGAKKQEKVMIMGQSGADLIEILHELALEYVMSPDGLTKYSQTGLSFNEFLKCLPPEKLEPYNASILWLDREAIRCDGKMLINRYELKGHLEARKRNENYIREARNVSERYARRMERLKAEGHPLISAWDSARVSDRALSWAWQFALSGSPDPIKFFEKKLAEYVYKAGLPPQSADGNGESDSQTA